MVAIAKIYQNQGKNEECQKMCQKILKIDPSCENATYIQTNLMLMRDLTEKAVKTYMELLD